MTATPRVKEVDGFKVTTAIRKLRRLRKRIRRIPGGTSAGKTFGIIPILIDQAAKTPLLEISIVSESIPHLRKGALKDFLKIMKATGRYVDANWNKTLLTYTFSNNAYIEFFSVDQEDKVRGPRRNVLYINEANNISFETYHQLAVRTSDVIWLDWNPSHEFWADVELKDDPDTETCVLTYKDNEALADSIVREIEKAKYKGFYNPELPLDELFAESNIKSSYWANWWKVYGLGLQGILEGVIFSNWTIINEVPEGARLIGTGVDFGFTNDPTSIVDVYKYDNSRVLDEICYKTGMVNGDIAALLRKNTAIYADSAEPKSIEEIYRLGIFGIKPTKKGADSINYGIQLMQGQKYLVTKRSVNLIKELRNYCWDKDKNDNTINKPIDAYNHAIDAVRYHEMMSLATPVMQWVEIDLD